MKYQARIIINDQATDGEFPKSFLLKMANMGALVCVNIESEPDTLYLEEKKDYSYFKNINKNIKK